MMEDMVVENLAMGSMSMHVIQLLKFYSISGSIPTLSLLHRSSFPSCPETHILPQLYSSLISWIHTNSDLSMRRPVLRIVIARPRNCIDIKVGRGNGNRIRVSINCPVKASGTQLCDLKMCLCNVDKIWVSEEVVFDGLMAQFDVHCFVSKIVRERQIVAGTRAPA